MTYHQSQRPRGALCSLLEAAYGGAARFLVEEVR